MAGIINFKNQLQKIKILGIDSSVFIYKFEQNAQYESLCSVVFERLSNNKLNIITSVVTVAEVLSKPLEMRDQKVIGLYEAAFYGLPNFELVELDYVLAKQAATLRAKYKILLPDAFQISASLKYNAQAFLTNDKKLKKVKELKILCLKDYV